jgi:tetratricopeptide (TPR) repeat protein
MDLYSVKETARLFDLRPAQLRYWTQTGFVAPTIRKGGRHFYTFRDLVTVKAAKDFLDSGFTIDKARPSLEQLRESLPERIEPQSELSVCGDGETVEVVANQQETAQKDLVIGFKVVSVARRIKDVLSRVAPPLPVLEVEPKKAKRASTNKRTATTSKPGALESAPTPVPSEYTVPHKQMTPYQSFLAGFAAEENGDLEPAEQWYRRALSEEPSFAAAHTNLGNVVFRKGKIDEARDCYESALAHEPNQPEARFNLGNLLDEVNESELAIAELRQAIARSPDFADAHYNLGVILLRIGGTVQARHHLETYLELDSDSPWAVAAKEMLGSMAPSSRTAA